MLYLNKQFKFLLTLIFLLVLFLIWLNKTPNTVGGIYSCNQSLPAKVKIRYTSEDDVFKDYLKIFDNDEAYEILNDTSILPPSARIVPKKIFKDKPLVIWATEWHMAPIKDIKSLLAPFGVTVLDYNLDPWRCDMHDCTAKNKLKVISC